MESDALVSHQPTTKTADYGGEHSMHSFLLISVCFGVAHGLETVAINYTSTEFGVELGSYSTGAINVAYTVVCLLAAAPLVQRFGPHPVLLTAFLLYAVFLACLWLALVIGSSWLDTQWVVVIFGSICSGVGSGLGFVAQGVQAATAAEIYAAESSGDSSPRGAAEEAANTNAKVEMMPQDEANGLFASYFAAIYVGAQCCVFLTYALLDDYTNVSFATIYLGCSVVVLGIAFVFAAICFMDPVFALHEDRARKRAEADAEAAAAAATRGPGDEESPPTHWGSLMFAVMRMAVTDPRAVAIAPILVAYAFTSIFISDYVNDETVDTYLSSDAVGYLGAIQSGLCAALAVPLSHLAKPSSYGGGGGGVLNGHALPLAIGALGYGGIAATYLVWSAAEVGRAGWAAVVAVYVCYALGRASYESTAKAIMADLYPQSRAQAYAYLNFVYGCSASAYSFSDAYFSGRTLAAFLVVPSALMVPGYLAARAMPGEQPVKAKRAPER